MSSNLGALDNVQPVTAMMNETHSSFLNGLHSPTSPLNAVNKSSTHLLSSVDHSMMVVSHHHAHPGSKPKQQIHSKQRS